MLKQSQKNLGLENCFFYTECHQLRTVLNQKVNIHSSENIAFVYSEENMNLTNYNLKVNC